jgi:hypothetical protein
MSLTEKQPSEKMSRRSYLWWILILIVVIGAGALVYFKGWYPNGEDQIWTEDKLPAVKVVILNGCGFIGLASEYADFIKDKNIDVVSLGDTPKPIYNKSLIVVRTGDMQDLKRLQKMTGIERYTMALTKFHTAEFDIIIGQDYELYMK